MGCCSTLLTLLATRMLIRIFRVRYSLSIISHLFCISKIFLAPKFLANLPTRYHRISPVKSAKIESIYMMPKEKNHCAAKNAQMKLTMGPSININQNIMRYLYLSSNTIIHSIYLPYKVNYIICDSRKNTGMTLIFLGLV